MTVNETKMPLRAAEVDCLLSGLERLPEDQKTTVTYTNLVRRLTKLQELWKKTEEHRQAVKSTVLQSKTKKRPQMPNRGRQ